MSTADPTPGEQGCPKCDHDDVDVGSIAATGDGLSRLFDIQTNRFQTVTCTNCGYTELYAETGSRASDAVDVFLG